MKESSHVALAFKEKETAWKCRRIYEKEQPGKIFGHTEKYERLFEIAAHLFIIDRDDLAWLQDRLVKEEVVTADAYGLDPVFTAEEISKAEKDELRKNGVRVAEKCEVCDTWMLSGHHKHRMEYCKICKRKTVHVIAFFGGPATWNCHEHGDSEHCHGCGSKLSLEEQAFTSGLGAKQLNCNNCRKR